MIGSKSVLIRGVLLLAGCLAAANATDYSSYDGFDILSYFPLQTGNYWDYAGTKEVAISGEKTVKVDINLCMKVISSQSWQNGEIQLFTMLGYPADALGFDLPEQATGTYSIPVEKYGLLLISRKVYFVDYDYITTLVKALDQSGIFLEDLEQQLELVLEFPLFDGQRFGDMEQLIRSDRKYFSYVTVKDDVTVKVSAESDPVYEITFATSPSYSRTEFKPGVGITYYRYHHNGTVEDVELKLVKQGLGGH